MTTAAQIFNVLDYGLVGDGVADDTVAIQNTINAAQANANGVNPGGIVYCPPSLKPLVTGNLQITTPISVRFHSFITYSPTSGVCLTIGSTGFQQYYDLFFKGFFQSSGNTGMPASVNSSGATAVQVNSLIFSKLKIDVIQGFTNQGIYFDGLGDVFAPQVVQHNRIDLGQVVNNGIGINCQSLNPSTSSVEANFVHVINCYQNFFGMICDPQGGSSATTSNYFLFDAIDNANEADGGQGIEMNGSYNRIDVTYTGANMWFGSASSYNTLNLYNTSGTGATYTAGGTGNVYNQI